MGKTKKTHSPTNISNRLSTFLSPLASCQCQLCTRCRGRVGHPVERVAAIVSCEGEVGHLPEGCGGNFEQDIEGGTVSVAREGDPKNSGYLTFEPDGMTTIK